MSGFQSLPGFRDFFPEEFALRSHIVAAWREAAWRYGFVEYDGPPLEPLELYVEKSGEEIVHQLYNFEDKGGRAVALRPEMTPTFARMVGSRARSLPKPIRWFSVPQLFRYERTQRGRLREHFQWNVDIVGETGVAADAEVLSVALEALRLLGLGAGDVVARVNDRRLLERLLLHAGVPEHALAASYAVIDKLAREGEAQARKRFADAGLADAVVDRLFGLFDYDDFDALARDHGDVDGVGQEIERLKEYFALLDALGWSDQVVFDISIVRGLAYYTGIVFEIFDRHGELRAVCGGGRYDHLLGALSGVDLPALGFGMGDVVLGELLKERGLAPDAEPALDYYVVAVTDDEAGLARRAAGALRGRGHSVAYGLRGAGVGRQFKDANARGARHAVVLGPDEVAAGEAVVREMATGEERRVPLTELLG
ncbi:MAG: histidine--tRNA ligase [Gemmatimonadota bacterium]|jgi:histidyl-tRNA synthetase